MVHVASNEVYASILTLVLAIVSGVLSLFVVLSVYMHPKSKESYHLRIVYNLLLADVFLAGAVVFYYIMQYLLTSRQLNAFCHYYLPSVIYLFLTSFSFTIMFALRFRTMKKPDNVNKVVTWKPPIPFGRLWVFPLVYVLPLLIFAYTLPHVTKVFANDSDTDQSCTFDHDYTSGVVLDLVYFEIPCLLTIVINIYSYGKGLIALKNAPHSVLGRQMRRAGGYLSVLLIVWIPNIIYNFLSIFTSDDYASFLNLCVVLSSSQGLLNVCVYVWSDPGLRRFIRKNAFFRKYFLKQDPHQSTRDSASHLSGMMRNSNIVRPSSHRRNTDDSLEDSGNDSNQDYEGIVAKTIRTSGLSDLTTSNQSTATALQSVQNPLLVPGSRGSLAMENRRSDETGPKSILIPKSRFSFKKEVSSSVGDLDQEKFVRFGEISTRIISSATTDTRPSDRESLTGRPEDAFASNGNHSPPPAHQSKKAHLTGDNEESKIGVVLEDIAEDEDDKFYDSDEGDELEDVDLDAESNLKPRDSNHKIFQDLFFKSRLSNKDENGRGSASANVTNDGTNRGYVPPTPTSEKDDDGLGWKVVNL